jgi:hypothetical protein
VGGCGARAAHVQAVTLAPKGKPTGGTHPAGNPASRPLADLFGAIRYVESADMPDPPDGISNGRHYIGPYQCGEDAWTDACEDEDEAPEAEP